MKEKNKKIDPLVQKLDNIKHELFSGGGESQAMMLITALMSDNTLNPSTVLNNIAYLLETKQRIIRDDYIIPVDCFFSGEEHMAYACLDNDLKFCVCHFGEENWKDVLYVMPYMNVTSAFHITETHKKINKETN